MLCWSSYNDLWRRRMPTPTDQLAERIRARDWDGVLQRLASHPWDAHYRTSSRATPLHLVCLRRGCPHDVVRAVLDCRPEAILATDSEGWTPLHVALLYGMEEETTLLLVRRGGAAAAAVQSPLLGTPLHVACRHGASRAVMEELLKVNPSMAGQSSHSGIKPATLLWSEFTKNPNHQHVVNELLSADSQRRLQETDAAVTGLLESLRLLVQAVDDSNGDALDDSLVHKVSAHLSDLDLHHFVPLLLRLYPEEAQRADATGSLPLHLVAASPARRMDTNHRRHFKIPLSDALEIMVQSYPRAAKIPDRDGRLALHLALERGRRTWKTGVWTLVKAAPEALLARDVQTYMYPVLLAAAGECDNEELDTVFELLQAHPPVLQYGLQ